MRFVCEDVFVLEIGMLKYLKVMCIMSAAYFQVIFLKRKKMGFVCICGDMSVWAYTCVCTHTRSNKMVTSGEPNRLKVDK